MENERNDKAPPPGHSCLVAGRQFSQQGDRLIDQAVGRAPNARHVCVRFDSREYFELVSRHPKIFSALRAARHVQLLVGDTVYEIQG